jgi:hypothetical protein
VYEIEREDVIKIISKAKKVGDRIPEDAPNYFILRMNNPEKLVPITLRCLYNFITISVSHMVANDSMSLSHFYFNYVFNAYANLDPELRYVMVTFKIGRQCLAVSFGSQPTLDQLLPGVIFPEQDLEEYKNSEDIHHVDRATDFEGDNLGHFKCFKLGKFERAFISNLAKDTESYLLLFKIISKLFRSCQILSDYSGEYALSPFRMDNVEPLGTVKASDIIDLIEPSENNMSILFSLKCSRKAIRNEIAKLYGHIFFNDERSLTFIKNVIISLNHEEFKEILNYERVLFTLLSMEDTLSKERIEAALILCQKVLDGNISEYAFCDTFTGMLVKFAKKSKVFRKHFYQHKVIDNTNKWLINNQTPQLQSYRSKSLFKNTKHNHKYSYDIIEKEVNLVKDYSLKRKSELKQMHKNADWEDDEQDSEDDMYEAEMEKGTKVDFVHPDDDKWVSGSVQVCLGEIVKLQREDEMEVDGAVVASQPIWFNKDDTGIAPYKTKSGNHKAAVLSLYIRAYNA